MAWDMRFQSLGMPMYPNMLSRMPAVTISPPADGQKGGASPTRIIGFVSGTPPLSVRRPACQARLRLRSANAAPRPASSMPAMTAGRTPVPVEASCFSLTVTVSFGLRASP